MLKKIFSVIVLILLVICTCGNVHATDKKTTLNIVQKASKQKELPDDQGYISKTIVDSDSENGEVTIELKLVNGSKEISKAVDTEIFLVVDNSGSMGYETSTGEVRRTIVEKSIRQLVNSIYSNASNIKVGLVRFAATGKYLSSGTELMCELTNDKSKMDEALTRYENLDTYVTVDGVKMEKCESGTNIEAGLKKASENFSTDAKNKIIVLLTDGIPNYSVSYSSNTSQIYKNTKERLESIGNSGITVISLMTGVTEQDTTSALSDANAIVEQIFGTEKNPTTGKFYNIEDANLKKVVTGDILKDVMEKVQKPITSTKIVDYFPADITENFEFSYVGKPNKGTVTDAIDETDKSITWNLGTVKGDETTTLKYKLKLKNMNNEKLLNKTISTNEKVVLTYQDMNSTDVKVELVSSPKIQLEEAKEELTAQVTYDPKTETTGKVKATITTNKKVSKVEGWTLSKDGKELTKKYSSNTDEEVHLVDEDGMTKDVKISVSNIISNKNTQIQNNQNTKSNGVDTTISVGRIPNAGGNVTILVVIGTIIIGAIVLFVKYKSYKDVK